MEAGAGAWPGITLSQQQAVRRTALNMMRRRLEDSAMTMRCTDDTLVQFRRLRNGGIHRDTVVETTIVTECHPYPAPGGEGVHQIGPVYVICKRIRSCSFYLYVMSSRRLLSLRVSIIVLSTQTP